MPDDLLNYASGGFGQVGNNFNDPSGQSLGDLDPVQFFLGMVPGYQFQFQQAQRAVQSNAAAQGTLNTGGTLKKLARMGTGVADQLYGDMTNRYLSLADLGLRGATAPFV